MLMALRDDVHKGKKFVVQWADKRYIWCQYGGRRTCEHIAVINEVYNIGQEVECADCRATLVVSGVLRV